MPYIKQEDRKKLLPPPGAFFAPNSGPTTPGELNFLITYAIVDYMAGKERLSYQVINDVVGALEGAKMEFYRRVAAPYEDSKIKENGDVY